MEESYQSPSAETEYAGPGQPFHLNVRYSSQQLNENLSTASADVALEPPDSGDFHEVFEVPDGSGEVAVVIGDVTGHGASASAKAQIIRNEVVSHLKEGETAAETVAAANEVSQSSDDKFSTLFVAKINGESGTVHYANAGHEHPMIADRDGNLNTLETSGPPLGVLSPDVVSFEEKTAHMSKHSTLLATTDGVTEARRPAEKGRQFFGQTRLREIFTKLRDCSPLELVMYIMDRIVHFTGSRLSDDVIVTAVQRHKRSQ